MDKYSNTEGPIVVLRSDCKAPIAHSLLYGSRYAALPTVVVRCPPALVDASPIPVVQSAYALRLHDFVSPLPASVALPAWFALSPNHSGRSITDQVQSR